MGASPAGGVGAVPAGTAGLKTIPLGAEATFPIEIVVLSVGVAKPMSTGYRAPAGPELVTTRPVTSARACLLVPRAGSIAMAIGDCTAPIVAAVREVAGEDPNKRPRLI